MKNANDLEWFGSWIVHNPIIPEGLHEPEAQRQRGQIFTNMARQRSIHEKGAGKMNGRFDTIS